MIWNDHSKIPSDAHAFLGGSQYSWLNWDPETLRARYLNVQYARLMGTVLHELAEDAIVNNIHVKTTDINMILLALRKRKIPDDMIDLKALFPNWRTYVNDCIDNSMATEKRLYYSDLCHGKADAISFEENNLKIFDYKSGSTPASPHQLEIYAALFCLEYGPYLGFAPGDITFELRIYQNNDIWIGNPTAIDIAPIMDKIILFNDILQSGGAL